MSSANTEEAFYVRQEILGRLYLHCIHHQELVSLLEIELNFSAALSAAWWAVEVAAVEVCFIFVWAIIKCIVQISLLVVARPIISP